MILSKSFGYALRGILYVASKNDRQSKVSIEEIARTLQIPRHFLAKVMKMIVRAGLIDSTRGQHGGFYLNEHTLQFSLEELILLVEGPAYFQTCLMGQGGCNANKPCLLHNRVAGFQQELKHFYAQTKIGDLLTSDLESMIQSMTSRTEQAVNLAETD